MKILFATSSEFYKKSPKDFEHMKNTIEEISGSPVLSITDKKFDTSGSENDLLKIVKYGEKIIKECDIAIAEGDLGSAGLGYDIAKLINLKKPTLILVKQVANNQSPHPMRINSNLLTYKHFNTEQELKKIIADFLVEAKQKLDTKFILIIPAEIDRYLEWASDYKRMHKAQIVRDAIEAYMEKDKEWKEKESVF